MTETEAQPSAASTALTEEQREWVEAHVNVVWAVVNACCRQGVTLDRDELFSLGQQGLVEAALRFDPDRETSFMAFAWPRVQGAMRNAMKKERRFRQRRQAISMVMSDKAIEFLEAARDEGAPFSDTEEMERERVYRMSAGFAAAIALGCARPSPSIEGERARRAEEAKYGAIEAAICQLPERDRTLIRRHYDDGIPLISIASEVGVSRATIYRRHYATLERLGTRLAAATDAR